MILINNLIIVYSLVYSCIFSVAGHNAESIKVPLSLYCASKYAITGLTQSVRNELTAMHAGIKITV